METAQQTARNKEIAETILIQLGGRKFMAMTGAKDLSFGPNGLQMRLPRNGSKANFLVISLNVMDLYNLSFESRKFSKGDFVLKVTKSYTDVYAEDLQRFFTEATGMYTSLYHK